MMSVTVHRYLVGKAVASRTWDPGLGVAHSCQVSVRDNEIILCHSAIWGLSKVLETFQNRKRVT